MISRYFIVEGESDKIILERLLQNAWFRDDTRVIVTGGYSAALSAIQTLFTLTNRPIYFFFDTDTKSSDEAEEKEQFIHGYLKPLFNNEFFLFPFSPETEILFFYNKKLLEKMLNKPISDELWQQGQQHPKKTLLPLIDAQNYLEFLKKTLSDDFLLELSEVPEIQDFRRKFTSILLKDL